MSYTPINWDENTPITAALLDRMDTGINENDDDLATIQGGEAEVDGRISTNEGRISTNEDDIASNEGRISTNENDISDFKDGKQSVAKATTIENITTGKYVGDGNLGRVIDLGFTPKRVTIQAYDVPPDAEIQQWDLIGFEEGYVRHKDEGHESVQPAVYTFITEDGFELGVSGATANRDGTEYIYFAIG